MSFSPKWNALYLDNTYFKLWFYMIKFVFAINKAIMKYKKNLKENYRPLMFTIMPCLKYA